MTATDLGVSIDSKAGWRRPNESGVNRETRRIDRSRPLSMSSGFAVLFKRCIYIDIHLLADVNRKVSAVETVDYLEHSSIDAFGAVARQRNLRYDIGLEPDKSQQCPDLIVAPQITDCIRVPADSPGIVLVHVHSDVHRLDVAEQDQGLSQNAGRSEFAEVNFQLHDLAVDG